MDDTQKRIKSFCEKLAEIDDKIKNLNKLKKKILEKCITEEGFEGQHVFKLDEPTDKGKTTVKYTLKDTKEDYLNNVTLFKNTGFDRYQFRASYLK